MACDVAEEEKMSEQDFIHLSVTRVLMVGFRINEWGKNIMFCYVLATDNRCIQILMTCRFYVYYRKSD